MKNVIFTGVLCITMVINTSLTSCTQKIEETERRLNHKIDSLQAILNQRMTKFESDMGSIDTKVDSTIMGVENLKNQVSNIEKTVTKHQQDWDSITKEIAKNKQLIKKISTQSAKTYSEVQKLKKLELRVDSLEKQQRESLNRNPSVVDPYQEILNSYEQRISKTSTAPSDTTRKKKSEPDPVTETEKTTVPKKRKKFL